MTIDEIAFRYGHLFGVEQTVDALDPLVRAAAEFADLLAWAAEREGKPELLDRARTLHVQHEVAMEKLTELKGDGVAKALAMLDLDRRAQRVGQHGS